MKFIVISTVLMIFWAQYVCAQNMSFIEQSKWRFQIEAGLNYSSFLDKNPRVNGSYFNLFKIPRFMGLKATYKKKHIFVFNSITHAKRVNIRPLIGIDYILFNIHTLGYGYAINIKTFNVVFTTQVSYRTGLERYIHDYYYSHLVTSGISYNKPWGGIIGIQVDYLVTNNIGIGINSGYYFFPFENTKLSGGYVEQINPDLVAKTTPNKQIFIGTLKLFYNFSLPKSLNRLIPF